jgi:hypothetical protein
VPARRPGSSNKKVYGAAKVREMQRSVLPSSAPRDARRSLDRVRRSARRNLAARLGTYRGAADRVTARAWDDEADLKDWPQHRLREAVLERREHDKVAPLIRWGRARTRALPQGARLDALRALLPKSSIGEHAMSHLERCVDLRNPRSFA